MNQFSNIGSMFPGAECKQLRENAKMALTAPGRSEITGLVIKHDNGDVTIVQKDQVQVFHGGQVAMVPIPEVKVDPIQIAVVECEYWQKVCQDEEKDNEMRTGIGLGGISAAGNIVAALVRGVTAEEFRKEKETCDENFNDRP